MAEVHWYIAREGQKIGPFTSDQVVQLANHGLLKPTEMLWTEGLTRWVEGSSFPGLFLREKKKYWLSVNGETRGPFAAAEVRTALAQKTVTLDTPACPENSQEWRPLSTLSEFREPSGPAPSPSKAMLLSGTLDVEEARLHLAGKSGDALARLISTLMDLRKAYADNPTLARSLDESIAVLRTRHAETAAGRATS